MGTRILLVIAVLVVTAAIVMTFRQSDSNDIQLNVGHCWIGPVEFEGKTWVVRKSEQFGWGGHVPEAWVGEGSITRLDEARSVYKDDSGIELGLVLEDSPAAVWLKKALCA